jgi:hypothetical protein
MYIATPTQEDIDQAIKLWCALREVFEDEILPIDQDKCGFYQDQDGCFNENDQEHLRILYEKLKQAFCDRPSAINRVIWGMVAIWDSGYIDKESDKLTLIFKE